MAKHELVLGGKKEKSYKKKCNQESPKSGKMLDNSASRSHKHAIVIKWQLESRLNELTRFTIQTKKLFTNDKAFLSSKKKVFYSTV